MGSSTQPAQHDWRGPHPHIRMRLCFLVGTHTKARPGRATVRSPSSSTTVLPFHPTLSPWRGERGESISGHVVAVPAAAWVQRWVWGSFLSVLWLLEQKHHQPGGVEQKWVIFQPRRTEVQDLRVGRAAVPLTLQGKARGPASSRFGQPQASVGSRRQNCRVLVLFPLRRPVSVMR